MATGLGFVERQRHVAALLNGKCVARMSGAISGILSRAQPGCRCAHPGYDSVHLGYAVFANIVSTPSTMLMATTCDEL